MPSPDHPRDYQPGAEPGDDPSPEFVARLTEAVVAAAENARAHAELARLREHAAYLASHIHEYQPIGYAIDWPQPQHRSRWARLVNDVKFVFDPFRRR